MSFDTFFRNFFGRGFGHTPDHSAQNENSGSIDIRVFGDLSSEFERMDQLFSQLFQESFKGFPAFTEQPTIYQDQPTCENSNQSLRDQMLKPGWERESSNKVDTDLDDSFMKNGTLSSTLPKPGGNGFHHSTSTSYFQSINGATESKSVSNDREGCRREITTREYGGKKYVVETRKCPGVPEEFIERLFDLKREELPEFLKRWDNIKNT